MIILLALIPISLIAFAVIGVKTGRRFQWPSRLATWFLVSAIQSTALIWNMDQMGFFGRHPENATAIGFFILAAIAVLSLVGWTLGIVIGSFLHRK